MSKKRPGIPVDFEWEDFQGLCVDGITAKMCCGTHWQLVGGRRLVNLWPTTGKMMLDTGETAQVRKIEDVESFIGKHAIYECLRTENGDHKTLKGAGIQYGIAVLQIEYWTAVRDGRSEEAIKALEAIAALQVAKT